jgi:hypothetical protein
MLFPDLSLTHVLTPQPLGLVKENAIIQMIKLTNECEIELQYKLDLSDIRKVCASFSHFGGRFLVGESENFITSSFLGFLC